MFQWLPLLYPLLHQSWIPGCKDHSRMSVYLGRILSKRVTWNFNISSYMALITDLIFGIRMAADPLWRPGLWPFWFRGIPTWVTNIFSWYIWMESQTDNMITSYVFNIYIMLQRQLNSIINSQGKAVIFHHDHAHFLPSDTVRHPQLPKNLRMAESSGCLSFFDMLWHVRFWLFWVSLKFSELPFLDCWSWTRVEFQTLWFQFP